MAADPTTSKPHGFAHLAKRISAWTTNGLLTLVILLAGLVFGRQVLKWWAADATPPAETSVAPLASDGLGDPAKAHFLQFGNQPWAIERQEIRGDKEQAAAALRAATRKFLITVDAAASEPPTTPAGERFLELLARSTPFDEEPGKWRLFQLTDGFPMTAGVRLVPNNRAIPPNAGGDNLAGTAYRVVVWGIAVPMGTEAWTLYTLRPSGPVDSGGSAMLGVPLPPGCSVTLALRVAEGGAMATWTGNAEPAQWKRYYEDWFARQGWRPAVAWHAVGAGWQAKYAAPEGNAVGAVDIRFGPDGRGQLNGLLMTTPK